MMNRLQNFNVTLVGGRLKLQIELEGDTAKYQWYLPMSSVESMEKAFNNKIKTMENNYDSLKQKYEALLREGPRKKSRKPQPYYKDMLDYLVEYPGVTLEEMTEEGLGGRHPRQCLDYLINKGLVYKVVTGTGPDHRRYYPVSKS